MYVVCVVAWGVLVHLPMWLTCYHWCVGVIRLQGISGWGKEDACRARGARLTANRRQLLAHHLLAHHQWLTTKEPARIIGGPITPPGKTDSSPRRSNNHDVPTRDPQDPNNQPKMDGWSTHDRLVYKYRFYEHYTGTGRKSSTRSNRYEV